MTPQPSEIVLLPFPFTDLSATKQRPVLVVTPCNPQGDFLAAQITSNVSHTPQVALTDSDRALGVLPKASIVRPDKLVCLNQSLVIRRVGILSTSAFQRIHTAICRQLGC